MLPVVSMHALPLHRTLNQSNTGDLPAIELLLQINSTQPFTTTMRSDQDFSYIDTPRTSAPITNATTIIPRQAEANPKLPAFVDGRLAWGGQPVAVSELSWTLLSF